MSRLMASNRCILCLLIATILIVCVLYDMYAETLAVKDFFSDFATVLTKWERGAITGTEAAQDIENSLNKSAHDAGVELATAETSHEETKQDHHLSDDRSQSGSYRSGYHTLSNPDATLDDLTSRHSLWKSTYGALDAPSIGCYSHAREIEDDASDEDDHRASHLPTAMPPVSSHPAMERDPLLGSHSNRPSSQGLAQAPSSSAMSGQSAPKQITHEGAFLSNSPSVLTRMSRQSRGSTRDDADHAADVDDGVDLTWRDMGPAEGDSPPLPPLPPSSSASSLQDLRSEAGGYNGVSKEVISRRASEAKSMAETVSL